VFRRGVFDLVGPFDESLGYGEDVDWFLRAREAGADIGIRTDVTLLYRRHGNNMTLDTERSNHYFLEALHKSLRRRRNRDGQVNDLVGIPALSGKTLADFQAPSAPRK
jgi:GT2 family glycosyltransferase